MLFSGARLARGVSIRVLRLGPPTLRLRSLVALCSPRPRRLPWPRHAGPLSWPRRRAAAAHNAPAAADGDADRVVPEGPDCVVVESDVSWPGCHHGNVERRGGGGLTEDACRLPSPAHHGS